MTVTPKGHWGGDPTQHCKRLVIEADDGPDEPEEVLKLALLNRVLSDPQQRERLLELAQRVEAEEAADLVGC